MMGLSMKVRRREERRTSERSDYVKLLRWVEEIAW